MVSLSVGFASFSTSLTIDGTGSVKSSSWKVKFENLLPVVKTGTASEVTAPTINTNDTNIGDYSVTLTTPGDTITYTFDITNDGTFDAEITSITVPTPTCTGTSANATADGTNVCGNVEYTLTYDNGTALAVGDKLTAGQSKTAKLKLTYKSTATVEQLPSNDVAISNLGITVVYSQD